MLIKNVEQKIKDLGFKKTYEGEHGITFERYNHQFNFTQVVDIHRKKNGKHLIQSYSKQDTTEKGSLCAGMTYPELKLFTKLMKKQVRKFCKSMR